MPLQAGPFGLREYVADLTHCSAPGLFGLLLGVPGVPAGLGPHEVGADGCPEDGGLQPAGTWEEGVANHLAYFEALREKMDAEYPGPPVRIVPTGLALANLKRELEAGRIPGLPSDRFFELHYGKSDRGPGWNIHMIEKGRYFVSLVLYCCFYGEPADRVSLPQETTTLTPEQDRVYRRIAWETVRDYRWSGVSDPPP